MIERLELKNFTVFDDLTMDFSPKINVIIGENGTGKTHLLKAAYGLCASAPQLQNKPDISNEQLEGVLTKKLLRLFMPTDDMLGKMHRRVANDEDEACLSAQFVGEQKIVATFDKDSEALAIQNRTNYDQYQTEAIFIPTKEVFSLIRGLTHSAHDRRTVELIFDDGYMDIATALMKSDEGVGGRINDDSRFNAIIRSMVNLIEGRYEWEEDGFCFQAGWSFEKPKQERDDDSDDSDVEDDIAGYSPEKFYRDLTVTTFVPKEGQRYANSMTAEGFRKIGILHRLLDNGTLDPGSSGPLFWDEPESNLNPKLMKKLVETLLELSRNGQQVVLATHDYVLLKWFHLLMDKEKEDHVRFHTLYWDDQITEDQPRGIKVDSTDEYLKIAENAIVEAFDDLTVAHAKSHLKKVMRE